MATNPKDALYASHAGTLKIGGENLLLLLLGIAAARLKNTALAAILAPKLLTATGIVTILNDVRTATPPAYVDDCLGYHANTIPSL